MISRELPIIFGQQDYLQQLGHVVSSTIAKHGCYLTSFAMAARYYGKDTDPVRLNEEFKNRNLFFDVNGNPGGNLMRDDNLTKIFPDIVYQKSYHYPDPTPADLNVLKQLLQDPTLFVILKIDTRMGFHHFAPAVAVNGVVKIANPWNKTVEDMSVQYGDPATNIIKYVVYKGNPATVEKVVDNSLVDQLRIDRDLNWNMAAGFAAKVGLSLTEDREKNIDLFGEKIELLNRTLIENAKLAEDYKKKYQNELNNVAGLKREISEIHSTDASYAEEVIDLEKKANASEEVVKEIATGLDVKYDEKDKDSLLPAVLKEFWNRMDLLKKAPATSDTIGQANSPITSDNLVAPSQGPTPDFQSPVTVKSTNILQDVFYLAFGWAFERSTK